METGYGFLAISSVAASLAVAVISTIRAQRIVARHGQRDQSKELEIALQRQALDQYALVTRTDSNGVILDVNQNFLDTMGFRRSEVVGQLLRNFHATENIGLSDEIRRVTHRGHIWSGETQMRRADGSIALTQTTVLPLIDARGRHVNNLSLRIDVSETRVVESERFLSSAFQDMLDPVIVHDPVTFRIVFMNGFALKDQGWKADEMDQKSIWDISYAKNREAMAVVCQGIHADGKGSAVLEDKVRNKVCEIQSYRICVAGGQVRVLSIFRDVTERARLERERGNLISVITHELRTPMTSIKGALGLLDAGTFGHLSAEAKSLVAMGVRNSDRMLGLIKNILDSEKAVQSELVVEAEALRVADAIGHAVEANAGYGAEVGVSFVEGVTPTDLQAQANPDAVQRILANLMSNAAKFAPKGSKVEVWATRDDDKAVLHVRDKGPGIPEAIQPVLFERFTSAAAGAAAGTHSSGLGLSIVKSLVDKMGGSIRYETGAGVGTCFHIALPLPQTPVAP